MVPYLGRERRRQRGDRRANRDRHGCADLRPIPLVSKAKKAALVAFIAGMFAGGAIVLAVALAKRQPVTVQPERICPAPPQFRFHSGDYDI